MLKHRRWAKFRATLGGWFWIACPRCGQWFSGHEKSGGTLWLTGSDTSRSGKCLCPECYGDYLAPGYVGYISSTDRAA